MYMHTYKQTDRQTHARTHTHINTQVARRDNKLFLWWFMRKWRWRHCRRTAYPPFSIFASQRILVHSAPYEPLADLITKTWWHALFYVWLQLQEADPITEFKSGAYKFFFRRNTRVIFGKAIGAFKKLKHKCSSTVLPWQWSNWIAYEKTIYFIALDWIEIY